MIAIRGGKLINGIDDEPKENKYLLIDKGRIKTAEAVTVPRGTEIINATGKTIMPGLIDAHVHIMCSEFDLQRMINTPLSLTFFEAAQNMRAMLEAGVTTARDAGGADLGIKLAVERKLIIGPRLIISVSWLSQTGGHGDGYRPAGIDVPIFPAYPGRPELVCDGPDEVRKAVRMVIRAGADVIKIMTSGGLLTPVDEPNDVHFRMDELTVIIEEARAAHKRVMSHAQSKEGIMNALRAGVHSIEHGIYIDDECIDFMKKHGRFLVPTLYAPVAVLELNERTGHLPASVVSKTGQAIAVHRRNIARAARAGVKIAMGTDSAINGHGRNARELGLLADAGLSPMQAIRAATKNAAECLGLKSEIGTIENGKLADLLIIDGDPLVDIRILENKDRIKVVMKNGEILVDRRRSGKKAG